MPLQATSGTASYDGFGGGVAAVPNYIEDVFSTYLYTGTGAAQTITNGIDLSGKGGLTWIKRRSTAADHYLCDTARGAGSYISSDTTLAQNYFGPPYNGLTAFNSNGFSLGSDTTLGWVNNNNETYVSWTFRKQPKFFDVVTFTGNGSPTNSISHNLGSLPGAIIVKATSTTSNWATLAGDSSGNYIPLNLNSTTQTNPSLITSKTTIASTTTFNAGWIGDNWDGSINTNGVTYVAYLFAHNAGGFGLTGTDNVISCGSWTTTNVGGRYDAIIDLGWEPQWVLFKPTNNTGNWQVYDNMRGWTANTAGNNVSQRLYPSLSNAEDTNTNTQLQYDGVGKIRLAVGASGYEGIYIAIRRGPMKVPTSGTSVFSNNLETSSTNPQTLTTGFPVDLSINTLKNVNSTIRYVLDRLRGSSVSSGVFLQTNGTNAETATSGLGFQNNTGLVDNGWWNTSGAIFWSWRRAPSFFDEVCYTGTGATQTLTHNLQATPELVIIKSRSGAFNWAVLYPPAGYTAGDVNVYLNLNTTGANNGPSTLNGGTAYTSTTFTVSSSNLAGASGQTYVAYLFATCAGVSKVGSYTGNGSTQTINCGFTGGARFVLVKRTDSTGDWYVWDTARGMVSGTDPSLLLNSTAAEVNANSIYTTTGGFQIVSTAAGINASGGSYIFLAIS